MRGCIDRDACAAFNILHTTHSRAQTLSSDIPRGIAVALLTPKALETLPHWTVLQSRDCCAIAIRVKRRRQSLAPTPHRRHYCIAEPLGAALCFSAIF